MNNNRTTELLKDYVFAIRRLDYAVDKPGSNMTLGEYEAEEKRVTDKYAQVIAATLGSCTLTAEQVRNAARGNHKLRMVLDADGMDIPQVTFDWQAIADELNATLGIKIMEVEDGK